MIRCLTFAGVVLAVAFMALSATINWRYGHSVGRDEADQLIYAAISLAADLAKAITPFFFAYASKNRRLIPACASASFWIVCTAYSLSSAAGFAEVNRAEQTGGLATKKSDHEALNSELMRKQSQLNALGTNEPPAVVEQKLAQLRLSSRWASSQECSDATVRESRNFCAEYLALEAMRQKGLAGLNLEKEIAALRTRVATLAGAAEVGEADPRAGFLVRLTGWSAIRVQTGYSILLIVVLEIGSGLGLFIALNHGELGRGANRQGAQTGSQAPPPRSATSTLPKKAPGDVAKFALARLIASTGQAVSFDELHSAYAVWCSDQGLLPLARDEFDRDFLILSAKVNFKIAKLGGAHVCPDLKLR